MRIGGDLVATDDTAPVLSPYDGHEVGRVPVGTAEHVDRAVAVALARHHEGPLPAHERAAVLDRVAAALRDKQELFARLIAEEAAKPIKTARVEAARAVDTFLFSAAIARTMAGEVVPMDASEAGVGKVAYVERFPIGVIGGITPFNFPLNLVAHKVAPAIAAGCPLVLKPASATPITALALAEVVVDEGGLPPGWLNVITVPGAVANHMVEHDDVAMITFTGSPEVGWGIRGRAPRKKVSLELGNNSPVIIEPDADLDVVAAKISVAGFSHAGQSCISVQRIFVHESVEEALIAKLVPLVEALKVGDPLDDATDVSALIDRGETDRVLKWIHEATEGGATIRAGGALDGSVLRPTVITGAKPDMKVCAIEVFGPVVAVQSYSSFDEAIALANDTRYGLQAGVFTADLPKAMQAARTLEFGGIMINEVPTWRADQMPYGGVRDSGNTKEGPAYTTREMTEPRLVVIQT
jgi:acyl-CoA reductase-like NAD-dependent aldehyde dehydrogenase